MKVYSVTAMFVVGRLNCKKTDLLIIKNLHMHRNFLPEHACQFAKCPRLRSFSACIHSQL